MNRECPICKLECSKIPSSKSAPVLPYLKSGKCCKHVHCRECLSNWLLNAPTRCYQQETSEGKLKRLDIGCTICREPIKGFWPILMGQVQELNFIWGPDDVRYVIRGEQTFFVPPKDTHFLKAMQYTRGYFFDGPNRTIEEITIEDEQETPHENETQNIEMDGNASYLSDAVHSLENGNDGNAGDLGRYQSANGADTNEEESINDTSPEENGGDIGGAAETLGSNMQNESVPQITIVQRPPKRYSCDICDAEFKTRSGLHYHKSGFHGTAANRHNCVICGKSYSRSSSLRVHQLQFQH